MELSRRAAVTAQDATTGARLLWGLGNFLRRRLSPEHARAIVRRRLESRGASFLALVRSGIYLQPASPYRYLLRRAGCEYGDLETLVRTEGVEGALRSLLHQGVYLTVDELKGRRPITRGSQTVTFDPAELRNPRMRTAFRRKTGGSRGRSQTVYIDYANIRDRTLLTGLPLDARGGSAWHKGVWGVAGAMTTVLQYSLIGSRPTRWFLQVDPVAAGLRAAYLWSGRTIHWASLLAGRPLPAPECHPFDAPLPIARWMSEVLRSGGVPHLDLAASSAVRLCQAAQSHGLDLSGAQLTIGREPVTAARLASIRQSGAHAVPRYATTESGPIGYGCLAPQHPDELHLHHDAHALIQAEPAIPLGLPPGALLITALQPGTSLILLNVSLGDQATLTNRRCGCPLENIGWTTHLHTIRSFEKLTGEGMTFLDTDVIRILEEILPAQFGGGPSDYQLLEQEDPDGRARLRLLVDPAIGPVAPDLVAETFLAALARGNDTERQMAAHWRQVEVLEVIRQAPIRTADGKILHLHQQLSRRG